MKIKYLTLIPLVACASFPIGFVSCNREKDSTIDDINALLQTPFKYEEGAVLQDDEY
ncbi:MAG: hypothetical protein MJ219_00200 [Mycoplasmoidaceae bacterium]|nr:hypothetical protein [Mycoplasmoidaceae bacterium]